MSDIKIENLSPVPFFARFLEGQFSKDLTQEEMKAILGGANMVTQAAPSDSDAVMVFPPIGQLPDVQAMIPRLRELSGEVPNFPITAAYPSDQAVLPQ